MTTLRLFGIGLFLLLAMGSVTATAETQPVVAVFEVRDSSGRLTPSQLEQLTTYLAARLARAQRFLVVPQEQLRDAVKRLKSESYKSCYDESCQIEIGRELAAQKSLYTEIVSLGKECAISSTLFDLAKAASELAATERGGCELSDLVNIIDKLVRSLELVRGRSAGTGDSGPPRLAILPLGARQVPVATARILDEVVAETFRMLGRYEVGDPSETRVVLDPAMLERASVCDDAQCATEAAEKLGAELVVLGTIGQLGNEVIVSLALVDVLRQKVRARKSARAPAGEANYGTAVRQAALQLLDLPLSEKQWGDFVAYRNAALGASSEVLDVDRWQKEIAPAQADWLSYLDYRRTQVQGGKTAKDFGGWHTEFKLSHLQVTTSPEGASVRIDGKEVGRSPLTLDGIEPGSHEVRIELAEHAPSVKTGDFVAGRGLRLRFDLLSLTDKRERAEARSSKLRWGWISLGASAALFTTAAVLAATSPSEADIRAEEYRAFLNASSESQALSAYDAVESEVARHNLFGILIPVAASLGGAAGIFSAIEFIGAPAK